MEKSVAKRKRAGKNLNKCSCESQKADDGHLGASRLRVRVGERVGIHLARGIHSSKPVVGTIRRYSEPYTGAHLAEFRLVGHDLSKSLQTVPQICPSKFIC